MDMLLTLIVHVVYYAVVQVIGVYEYHMSVSYDSIRALGNAMRMWYVGHDKYVDVDHVGDDGVGVARDEDVFGWQYFENECGCNQCEYDRARDDVPEYDFVHEVVSVIYIYIYISPCYMNGEWCTL